MSLTAHAESPLTVACIQMEPRVGAKQANVGHSVALIDQASANGARLIVLPELCNSGYTFESRREAFELSEPISDGPTTQI
jgi:N-carbamoylputrescine amidase